MPLIPMDLINRLCEMEGSDWATMNAENRRLRVGQIKAALRWAWKTDNPLFAFPFTMDSATVDVTNGVIALDDLGDQSLVSLWTADPRPDGNTALPLGAVTSNLGVHPRSSERANLTSCFAFFRKAVPTFDYAADSDYDDPDDIPDQLLDMVACRALSSLFVGKKLWDAVNALKATYDSPAEQKDALMAALIESKMVWQRNLVLIAAVAA